ncbi:MAG: alkaline phosphatase family protein [Nanoarchaeota archaeon]
MKPDYRNSIVNLMASISGKFGCASRYAPLRKLPPRQLQDKVMLLVIDGLGYSFLMRNSNVLKDHCRGSITSVFPPTTASAITTFLTGTAPQQHSMTGWHMLLKEVGCVYTPLPNQLRFGPALMDGLIDPSGFVTAAPLSLKTPSYHLVPEEIVNSAFNRGMKGKAKTMMFTDFPDCLKKAGRVLASKKKVLVYAYWPGLDSIAHEKGIGSRAAQKHFLALERALGKFIATLSGKTLIVTADHGFIDTAPGHRFSLRKHPELERMLILPLCGESRTAYAYVHPSRTKDFERYVRRHVPCVLKKREAMVKEGYFGIGKPHAKLMDRIGDYALLMKEDYCIKDTVLCMDENWHKGNHGGSSSQEILVPLIIIGAGTPSRRP